MTQPSNFHIIPGDVANLRELIKLLFKDLDAYRAEHKIPTRIKQAKPGSSSQSQKSVKEPHVRQYVVGPLLNWMGWGLLGDAASLGPEHVFAYGLVDYVCRIGQTPVLAVECKALHQKPLGDLKSVMQACTYGNCLAAKYSILTDGVRWHIYDTFKQVEPQERLVRTLDLRRCSTEEAAGFFNLISKRRAASGPLRITGAVDKEGARAPGRKGRKRRNRRASLNTPSIKQHVDSLGLSFGGALQSVEGARNTFTAPGGQKIRFCVSATEQPMFNIGVEHLEDGLIYLVHATHKHGWLLPAERIRRYLVENLLDGKSQWTPKVSVTEDGDFLWLKKSLPPLPLTSHRHHPGTTAAVSRSIGSGGRTPLENRA